MHLAKCSKRFTIFDTSESRVVPAAAADKLLNLINSTPATIARVMEPRIYVGLFLILACVINTESHPRHESTDTRTSNNNKLLTDFSDDVVSRSQSTSFFSRLVINIINLRSERARILHFSKQSFALEIKRDRGLSILDEVATTSYRTLTSRAGLRWTACNISPIRFGLINFWDGARPSTTQSLAFNCGTDFEKLIDWIYESLGYFYR